MTPSHFIKKRGLSLKRSFNSHCEAVDEALGEGEDVLALDAPADGVVDEEAREVPAAGALDEEVLEAGEPAEDELQSERGGNSTAPEEHVARSRCGILSRGRV